VLCIWETKSACTAQYVVGESLFALSGHGGPGPELSGVGFVLGRRVRKVVSGFEVHADGRCMSLVLDTVPGRIAIICTYIPQSGRPKTARTQAFEVLARAIEKAETKGVVLVLGDFNARLHGRLKAEQGVLGPHIYGSGVARLTRPARGFGEKSNRDLLIDMCIEHGMRVMNTWFSKPDCRKVMHVPPGVGQVPEPGAS